MKKLLSISAIAMASLLNFSNAANADEYTIDTKMAHASINFQISHLGYSYVTGRFNTFAGTFDYVQGKPEQYKVSVKIDPSSVDTNHAERDKHLKGKGFLDVEKFKESKFISKKSIPTGEKTFDLVGDLTLHGITKEITIHSEYIGEGKDPWGGYRVGFKGDTKLKLKDFGIDYDLGESSNYVDMVLIIEGVKK